MKKLYALLIIITVAVIGVCAGFVLTPQPLKSVYAFGGEVLATSEVITGECIVTFKTIDGEILAEVETIEGLIPTNLIPNAPFIMYRPFLRWTNVQGFAIDGIITANITFLPLYSYDPTWDGTDNGDNNGNNGSNNDGNKKPGEDGVEKTQWVWMNFILDEKTVIFGSLIGILVVFTGVVIFLKLLRGVIYK